MLQLVLAFFEWHNPALFKCIFSEYFKQHLPSSRGLFWPIFFVRFSIEVLWNCAPNLASKPWLFHLNGAYIAIRWGWGQASIVSGGEGSALARCVPWLLPTSKVGNTDLPTHSPKKYSWGRWCVCTGDCVTFYVIYPPFIFKLTYLSCWVSLYSQDRAGQRLEGIWNLTYVILLIAPSAKSRRAC